MRRGLNGNLDEVLDPRLKASGCPLDLPDPGDGVLVDGGRLGESLVTLERPHWMTSNEEDLASLKTI